MRESLALYEQPIAELDLWVTGRALEIAATGREVTVNLAEQSIGSPYGEQPGTC